MKVSSTNFCIPYVERLTLDGASISHGINYFRKGQSETRGKGFSCERMNQLQGYLSGLIEILETFNLGSTSDSNLGALSNHALLYLLGGTSFRILTLRNSRAELYAHSLPIVVDQLDSKIQSVVLPKPVSDSQKD